MIPQDIQLLQQPDGIFIHLPSSLAMGHYSFLSQIITSAALSLVAQVCETDEEGEQEDNSIPSIIATLGEEAIDMKRKSKRRVKVYTIGTLLVQEERYSIGDGRDKIGR